VRELSGRGLVVGQGMESCKISEQNGISQFLDFTLEAINNKGESNDKKSTVISSDNANMWDQQCAISSRECDEVPHIPTKLSMKFWNSFIGG
jgi:hypothetical protein